MTTDELQEHYQHLDSGQIEELALYEVRDLRPEAVRILRTEIQRRGLPRVFHEAIDLQISDLTEADQQDLMSWLRASACPLCGSTSVPLNACEVSNVRRLGFASLTENQLITGCPQCLSQQLTRASRKAYTSGCLALPWGWFRAAKVTDTYENTQEILKTNEPTPELKEYVVRCAGGIHAARAGGLDGVPDRRPTDRTV